MVRDRRYERDFGTSCFAGSKDPSWQEQAQLHPHTNCGDYVIVINADKVKLTGAKMTDKVYTRYTGFPGGQRFATPEDFLTVGKKPEFVVEHAVRGMLPKTRLGEAIMKNLKVYAGAEHPHAAQNPKEIKLNEIK